MEQDWYFVKGGGEGGGQGGMMVVGSGGGRSVEGELVSHRSRFSVPFFFLLDCW